MTAQENKDIPKLHSVWTKCSDHPAFEDIGCAIYVQTSGQEPYIIACTYPKSEDTEHTPIRLIASALALDHFDLDAGEIELHIPDELADIVERVIVGSYFGDISEDVELSIEDQADNITCISENARHSPHKALLMDVAWYVRNGKQEPIMKLASKHNIDIRIMTPVITGSENEPDELRL